MLMSHLMTINTRKYEGCLMVTDHVLTPRQQRLRDMKIMQKDPHAAEKARRAERKADEKSGLITIKPLKIEGAANKGGFKKGGFKSAFGPSTDASVELSVKTGFKKTGTAETDQNVSQKVDGDGDGSEDEAVGYEYYDPRQPTGCAGTCGLTKV